LFGCHCFEVWNLWKELKFNFLFGWIHMEMVFVLFFHHGSTTTSEGAGRVLTGGGPYGSPARAPWLAVERGAYRGRKGWSCTSHWQRGMGSLLGRETAEVHLRVCFKTCKACFSLREERKL
jgi:hypothetical protein